MDALVSINSFFSTRAKMNQEAQISMNCTTMMHRQKSIYTSIYRLCYIHKGVFSNLLQHPNILYKRLSLVRKFDVVL